MGSFSLKLARKWAQRVLMEICVFIYASNAAGKSQEVLYWLMQKHVKLWNPSGNWNYFPTTFMLLNAAAVPPTSLLGPGGTATLSPLGSSVPGLGQGGSGCLCSALWHWEYLIKDSLDAFELGGRDISSKLLWEFLVCPKQGIFPSLFERGSFQNFAFMWLHNQKYLLISLYLELYVSVK